MHVKLQSKSSGNSYLQKETVRNTMPHVKNITVIRYETTPCLIMIVAQALSPFPVHPGMDSKPSAALYWKSEMKDE